MIEFVVLVGVFCRKAGFEAIQKKVQNEKDAKTNVRTNGAWGPVFKSKTNFVNLHIS